MPDPVGPIVRILLIIVLPRKAGKLAEQTGCRNKRVTLTGPAGCAGRFGHVPALPGLSNAPISTSVPRFRIVALPQFEESDQVGVVQAARFT